MFLKIFFLIYLKKKQCYILMVEIENKMISLDNMLKSTLTEYYNQGKSRFATFQHVVNNINSSNIYNSIIDQYRGFFLSDNNTRKEIEQQIISTYNKLQLSEIIDEIQIILNNHSILSVNKKFLEEEIKQQLEIKLKTISLENNKNIFNNMDIITRKKRVKLTNVERNYNRLSSKVNKINNTIGEGLGKEILELYETRKVSQFHGAEKIIDALKNEGTQAIANAYIFIDKNKNNESIQDKNKKRKAASKIANKFRKHIEPKVEYKKVFGEDINIKKFGFELHLDHSIYDFKTLAEIFPMIKEKLITEVKKILLIKGVVNCKMLLGVESTFVRVQPNDKKEKNIYVWKYTKNKKNEDINVYEELTKHVKTKIITVYSKKKIDEYINTLYDKLISLFVSDNAPNTKWILKRINYIFVELFEIKPARGSSHIPTPEKYKNAKCGIINIKNDDQECFKWCMKYHQTKKIKQ